MSRMTYLNPPETSVDMITSFGGYNHNISISDGEFYDMENLSSDKFPLVSIRGKRVKLGWTSSNGYNDVQLYSNDASGYFNGEPCLIAENNGIHLFVFQSRWNYPGEYLVYPFTYNEATGKWVGDILKNTGAFDYIHDVSVSNIATSYVNMGAYIVLFPMKFVYNTIKKTIFPIECTLTNDDLTVILAQRGGEARLFYEEVYVQSFEPESPNNNDCWFDRSTNPVVLKKYSESSGMWYKIDLCLRIMGDLRVSAQNKMWQQQSLSDGYIFTDDAIEIDFSYDDDLKKYLYTPTEGHPVWIVNRVENEGYGSTTWFEIPIDLDDACTSDILQYFRENTDTTVYQETGVSARFKRRMPEFDFITESNNRLWACRYGNDIHGEPVNEIFACKLGDPLNWRYFNNTSIDSYYLSLGVGGEFTGAMTYQSNPVFFKEDSVHRIYGNYPSNYQLKTIMGYGVQPGSDKSLTELNNTVYYLSNNGIMAYQGGIPNGLFLNFGPEKYKAGIASSAGNKMYMTMLNSSNQRELFVYDDRFQTWHKETGIALSQMFTSNSKAFCVADHVICLEEFNDISSYEDDVEWYFDTGKIGFASPMHKYVNKVVFRMRLSAGSRASMYIQYDSDGNWNHVADIRPTGKVGSIQIPITPQRCDHFNIKVKGAGEAEVISMTKFYEESNEYD